VSRVGHPDTRPVVAVAGIAFDPEGRVLLIRRGRAPKKGSWTVPGGKVELGESLHAACIREFCEETGLRVTVGPVVEVFESIHRDGQQVVWHYVIIDYLVAVCGGELRAGDDAGAVRYYRLDELDDLPVTDGLQPVVAKARGLWEHSRRGQEGF